MISLNTRHYEKWMGQNGQNDSQGCRIYWHTTRHHKKVGVSKKLENLSSTTSTVHRADKQASAREFDFEGPSATGTASGEVSMDITPNLARIFGSLFRYTLGDIGSNPR
jgi:hypothetical protein